MPRATLRGAYLPVNEGRRRRPSFSSPAQQLKRQPPPNMSAKRPPAHPSSPDLKQTTPGPKISFEEAFVQRQRVSTGVPGLDEVLHGGFLQRGAYLVRGGPGAGKTTLGLHFLIAGAAQGEPVLFITLGEPEETVRANASRQGFDLRGVHFLDLSPTPEFFAQVEAYDIFSPAEVEREPVTRRILEAIEEIKPARVFIDSMSQFRYLCRDAYQFRKQTISFLRFLAQHQVTVLFSSEASPEAPDEDLQFLADGVLELEVHGGLRRLAVRKFRGSDFDAGFHSYRITSNGLAVTPRLVPESFTRSFTAETIPSGIPALDELLHGGLERGTVTLISGPAGVGKSTLGLQFAKEAAGRGERSAIFLYEESPQTLLARCANINIPVQRMVEQGTLSVTYVEALRFTPDEFAALVRKEVEEKNSSIVMIDSVAGYQLSLHGEDLAAHLHALTRYLGNMGVTTLLVNEVESITGEFRPTEKGLSYLADTLIFLRFIEVKGELRKAIGVLKKRLSDFEKTLRELEITRYGIKVGRPLTGFRGLLTGAPEFAGSGKEETPE